MIPLIVGVTSHRDIAAGEIASVRALVREFFERLQREFPQMPLVVLSALAEGGDQLAAAEALAAGARLVAPLPLPPDLYVEDFTGPEVRERFEALCAQAEIVQLPLLKGHSRHTIGSEGPPRDRQYAQAGVYIASHCHILLAIWDGRDSHRLGGTAQIVKYHFSGLLPGLIERHPGARQVLGGGDERLLYHIVCSRAAADGSAASGLAPLQTLWRTAEGTFPASAMPEDFRLLFTRMADFNVDCGRYGCGPGAAGESAGAGPSAGAGGVRADIPTVESVFEAADWLAIHFQRRVLLAMRTTYTLAALMGIAFTFYAHLQEQNGLIYLFLALFACGGFVAVLAHRNGWHRKYLDYRALAEGLRVQSYWRRAGITAVIEHEFFHDNFLQRQNIELGWIRNIMRAASLYPPPKPAPGALAEVISEWVGESGRCGQLDYFERKTAERTGVHRVTETIGSISLWGGIAISVFLALFALRLPPETKTTLVMIMAVLSIVAAVREAYAHRKADKELIRQYRFMQRIFRAARAALDRTAEPAEQRAILLALGDAALTEHAEWTLMHRERHVEHSRM
ncbi:MAG TPA: hypothetical protein VEU54_00085 [Steroidobacteraceae bacterium]|nr:hypothetical protein [Steroidobacteraceae bacterium]